MQRFDNGKSMNDYTRYGAILYEYKSKKYIIWFKNRYPKLDAHHILSKKIDFLLYPVRHQEHITVVHKHKSVYFEKWLRESVDIFLQYVNEKFFPTAFNKFTIADYEPETLKELFIMIHKLENPTN